LNEDREIYVADSLYKYTETGLYFCLAKDKQKLYDYLNKLTPSSKRNQIAKIASRVAPCAEEMRKTSKVIPESEVTLVSPGISQFVPAVPPVSCNTNSIPNPTPVPVAALDPKIQLNDRINALPICDGDNTSWFQGIFGKNYSCIEYFDSRHRIKTEFWDQNWFFYKSVGTEVRTQVKTLWIWWASDSDEIYLGINRIYLKYDNPIPEINSIPYLNTFPSYNEVPVYMYKGEFKISRDNYGGFIYPTFIKANSALPFFEFGKGGNMLNIYIRKLPFSDDGYTYNIRSESNVKRLYKLGIDFLKDNFNSGAKTTDDFVVSYQSNPQAPVEVLYFGERLSGTNTNIIKNTFYVDREWQITAAYSSSGGTTNTSTGNDNGKFTFSFEPPKHSYFRDYIDFELDFFGLARQGSVWKGSRMLKKQ
jgi:hypothetical protein